MKCNNSSFTGDIIIEDGVLYTATQAQGSNIKNYGTLGNSYTNRQIVVCSNAVLYLNRAECLARVGNETPTLTMVLTNNATLKIVGYNTFGNMRIYGKPKFDFTSPTNGKQSFGFSENTYVKTDDCLVMRPGNMNTESGYFACLDHRFEKEKINDVTYGYSNLCIDRIVNSESNFIDMMLDYIVYDHMNNTVCGIVKTGNGVLALNRANAYRNRTLVREGGLWLGRTTGSKTGSVVSNVVVSSGAFVGGVGTMKRDLTIEEGGGFMVDATNRTARLTVNGTLTLPTAGLIKLYNVAERDVSKIKMDNLPLPSCATISGLNNLNAPAWKVQVDGLTPRETRNLKVTFNLGAAEGPSYSIAAQTGGLMVIVR